MLCCSLGTSTYVHIWLNEGQREEIKRWKNKLRECIAWVLVTCKWCIIFMFIATYSGALSKHLALVSLHMLHYLNRPLTCTQFILVSHILFANVSYSGQKHIYVATIHQFRIASLCATVHRITNMSWKKMNHDYDVKPWLSLDICYFIINIVLITKICIVFYFVFGLIMATIFNILHAFGIQMHTSGP